MKPKASTVLYILASSKNLGGSDPSRTALVKIAYLTEMLRPVYSVWSEAFQFVRYRHGPYADDINRHADFLVFHGLARIMKYERGNSRVEATYRITDRGMGLYVQLRSKSRDHRAALVEDIIWSLQGLGVSTATDLCRIVYQEPAFADVLANPQADPTNLRDAVPLPSSLSARHPSFCITSVLQALCAKPDSEMLAPPREIVRAYIVYLAEEAARARRTEGSNG